MPRRPVPRNAGAVARPGGIRAAALLVASLTLLTGCALGPVEIAAPATTDREAAACADLVPALPDRLVDQERREVAGEHGAAWGDPAIVLRCGVGEADGFDELSTCQVVNDVAWYIPEEQVTGEPTDITMTTVGRFPGIEVALPADYFPPAAAMAQLSRTLLEHSVEVEPCG